MANLYTNFKDYINSGRIPPVAQGFANSESAFYSATNKMVSELSLSQNNLEGFTQAFNSNSSIITDKVADIEDGTFTAVDDLTGKIDDEAAEGMYDTLLALKNRCVTEENPKGIISITGQDGKIYQFMVLDQPEELFGYEVYVATAEYPNNIGDALLYKDGDDWILNPVVRCSNYNMDLWDIVGSNCHEDLSIACIILNITPQPDLLHCLNAIILELGIGYVSADEIIDGLQKIVDYYEAPYSVMNVEGGCRRVLELIKQDRYGDKVDSVKLIYDLIKECADSSYLSDFIIDVSKTVINGFFNTTEAIATYVATRAKDACNSVKQCAEGCMYALRQGGVIGLLQYLLSYYAGLNSVEDEDDNNGGCLSFTNNYSYIPQSFMVGILSTAAIAVSSVISVISYAINPIVGLITTAVSGAISLIKNIVEYKFDSMTLAAVNGNAKSPVNIFPLATMQYTLSSNDYLLSNTLIKLVNEIKEQGVMYLEVFGGCCVIGLDATVGNADNVWPNLVFEFHPLIADNSPLWDDIIPNLPYTTEVSYGLTQLIIDDTHEDNVQFIKDNYGAEGYVNEIPFVNSIIASNGAACLSAQDDATMRKICIANTCLFLYMYEPNLRDKEGTTFTVLKASASDPQRSAINLFASMLDYSANSYNASWTDIISAYTNGAMMRDLPYQQNAGLAMFGYIFNGRNYCGAPVHSLSNEIDYPINLPAYERSTALASLIITGIVTIATATAAAIATIKVKKLINNKRASLSAKAEELWDTYKKNPNSENYAAYRKTVKKNNRFASIFGGTKYSTEGFWASSDSGDPSSSKTNYSSVLCNSDVVSENNQNLNNVVKLIKGL